MTREDSNLEIYFRDPPTVKDLFIEADEASVTYTVEILPPTDCKSVFAFKVGDDGKSYTINAVSIRRMNKK